MLGRESPASHPQCGLNDRPPSAPAGSFYRWTLFRFSANCSTEYTIMSSELIWQLTKKHNAFVVSNSGASFDKDPLNLTNVHNKKSSGIANAKAVGVAAGKNGAVLLVKNRRAAQSKPSKLTTAVRFSHFYLLSFMLASVLYHNISSRAFRFFYRGPKFAHVRRWRLCSTPPRAFVVEPRLLRDS